MAAVRPGFRRFVVSLQYHGSSFLGFSRQVDQENRILPDGTDLRGYFTVESRLRDALTRLVGEENYENIQVSSRTDRGVHALKNTLHVDIRTTTTTDHSNNNSNVKTRSILQPERIHRGLNFYLARSRNEPYGGNDNDSGTTQPAAGSSAGRKRPRNAALHMRGGGEWVQRNSAHDVRILAVKEAPGFMRNPRGRVYGQAETVDWNARFSATERTYVYRILHTSSSSSSSSSDAASDYHDYDCWAGPFEWDRSWRVRDIRSKQPSLLDVTAMREAASFLVGTHDFTAFRAAHCQRNAPIMTLSDVRVHVEPYGPLPLWTVGGTNSSNNSNSDGVAGGLLGLGCDSDCDAYSASSNTKCRHQLVRILYRGDSFLYRQVRFMTGCLVQVGQGRLKPTEVRDMLLSEASTKNNNKQQDEQRGRTAARRPQRIAVVAPAHGLFLVDVQHEGIRI